VASICVEPRGYSGKRLNDKRGTVNPGQREVVLAFRMPEETKPVENQVAPTTGESSFAALGVCAVLCDACRLLNYREPTPIQREAIPAALAGKDIVGLAQTGSGKTAAFAIPILQFLLEDPRPYFALVLSPTRELAFQISEQFLALGSEIGVRVATLVGGMDMVGQAVTLAKRPHVVVGTPGRVVDHLTATKGFTLKHVRILVLDEADRLLNMDFEEELDQILAAVPRSDADPSKGETFARKTYLFSATMTSQVAKLQRASLRSKETVRIEVSAKYSTVETLVQHYLFIPEKYKDCYLTYLFEELVARHSCIVFTDTQSSAQRLALMLRNLGYGAVCIHGGMSQPNRLGALNQFKSGEKHILVATDVASRGLDIPLVDFVINYDIPPHGKDYIHRVGRTARAGRTGRAISLVSQYDVELFQKVEKLLGRQLEALAGVQQEHVLLLLDRVSEAARLAVQEIREEKLVLHAAARKRRIPAGASVSRRRRRS
jgi:ATP-dependent RNA helicase DDX47/RRP3